mmetsp:Transcript_107049/g.218372  ORF Transcript_107049/g.218372 Transcript_107049/m.218372 type:complete len:127 (+) Transcript_107049:37-417(+)
MSLRATHAKDAHGIELHREAISLCETFVVAHALIHLGSPMYAWITSLEHTLQYCHRFIFLAFFADVSTAKDGVQSLLRHAAEIPTAGSLNEQIDSGIVAGKMLEDRPHCTIKIILNILQPYLLDVL